MVTTSGPNTNDTPLSLSPQPCLYFSGSDQSRSHKSPASGTSVGFQIFLICSSDLRSGESPPCMQRILSSMRAATGRQLKQSVKVFQSLMLYLLLHQSQNPYILLMDEHSWLPRSRKKFQGYFILQARRRQIVYKECFPRSTQSPRKRQLASGGYDPCSNSLSRSQYWPWMSPQIFKGASNSIKMGCWKNISRDMMQSPLISFSAKFTCLPGLLPLTERSFSMILSTLISTFLSI